MNAGGPLLLDVFALNRPPFVVSLSNHEHIPFNSPLALSRKSIVIRNENRSH